MSNLSSEDRLRLLHSKLDECGETLLYLIAEYDETGETMKTVLELVSKDQHHHLLSVQMTGYQGTPLHWVCAYNNGAVLEVIMRLVTSEQTRYKFLQLLGSLGDTPLHTAARRNKTQVFRIIHDSVSSHHFIHLLTITNLRECTPVQTASMFGHQEAVKTLQDCHSTALIGIALQQTDPKGIAITDDNNKNAIF